MIANYALIAWQFIHTHIMYLNNSKFFAGVMMMMLNIGSRLFTIHFNKSTEEYLKLGITQQLLLFAIVWMGTRDIYVAITLTAAFTILTDHLFNNDSAYCIVPDRYKTLINSTIDTNDDGVVSDKEIADATAILDKAKKVKQREDKQKSFAMFHDYGYGYGQAPDIINT